MGGRLRCCAIFFTFFRARSAPRFLGAMRGLKFFSNVPGWFVLTMVVVAANYSFSECGDLEGSIDT